MVKCILKLEPCLYLVRNNYLYAYCPSSNIYLGFWRLEDKIGMSLDDIHTSGNVPHCKCTVTRSNNLTMTYCISDQEKLQPSMTRFFRKLEVEKPVWRNNFFFQVIDDHESDHIDPLNLAWCENMGGPEDGSQPKRFFSPRVKPSTIVYRTERQTLRRLPRTGALLFTWVPCTVLQTFALTIFTGRVRTYLVPLEEIVKEPGVPERLASAVRGMSDETWR